ncbi:MAG: bifunctional folylpolyglutamate synthase/dihydrofolate synthase [Candidatus Muiribacteriota bacterium]
MNLKDYMHDFIRSGQKYELKKVIKLLQLLGNPQDKYKTVHISGTNGKGSTSTFLEYIFNNEGLLTAKFTSPHLVSYNERLRVGLKEITEQEFDEVRKKIDSALKKLIPLFEEHPSFFEIMTAIGFTHFYCKKAKWAIIETGLGGRLDATNTMKKSTALITNVDFDHTGILGKTLKKIAVEKAGIIKENSILITGEKRKHIQKIFTEIASQKNSEIYILGKHFQALNIRETKDSTLFDFSFYNKYFKDLKISMAGPHQVNNAACAVMTAITHRISEKSIRVGLEKAFFPGRLEFINKNPDILMDGAHNPGGIRSLDSFLNNFYKNENNLFLCSILRDKNPDFMFSKFSKYSDKVFLTNIKSPRVMDKEKMIFHAKKHFKSVKFFSNSSKALCETKNFQKKTNCNVFITGSLYLLGELKKELNYERSNP